MGASAQELGRTELVEFLTTVGDVTHRQTMRRYAEAIHRELLHPSAGGALVGDAMAQALCVEICRRYTTGTVSTRRTGRATLSPAELGHALDALEAGIGENPGLEAIAAAAGVSTYRFAPAFREAVGQSPHQYLIERRVARARERLEAGTESIAEIAYACGFSSQAHLTSTFTRRLGISPGRYREERRR